MNKRDEFNSTKKNDNPINGKLGLAYWCTFKSAPHYPKNSDPRWREMDISSPIHNQPRIPLKLRDALEVMRECTEGQGIATEHFLYIVRTKPWIIDAMDCTNIRQGVFNGDISLNQLTRLSEEQVVSLRDLSRDDLKSTVEDYINNIHEENVEKINLGKLICSGSN